MIMLLSQTSKNQQHFFPAKQNRAESNKIKKNNLKKIIKLKYNNTISTGKYKNKKFIDVHNSKDEKYNKNIYNKKNIKSP